MAVVAWRAGLCAAALAAALGAGAQSAPRCGEWQAELTALEGTVEVQRAGLTVWTIATPGEHVCRGDSLRVQGFSRATVTLPDQSTLRLDEHTTLSFAEPPTGIGSLLELLRGVIHVISRDPRSLTFSTPYANAGLEGTEFDIRIAENEPQTEITVLEGSVTVTTPAGEIGVPSGNIAIARAGQRPVASRIAEPIDLMRWASYYPPLLGGALPEPDQPPLGAEITDAEFFSRRAAARLRSARVDGAQTDLTTALQLDPSNATATALRALLALARGDQPTAQRLATEATVFAPNAAVPLLALSYAQQGNAALADAARSIEGALRLEPMNAMAWARLAELDLARGDVAASIEHATHAAALEPALGYAQTVLGFTHLRGFDTTRARTAFERAITLDQAAPLPRLGLALALMQQGALLDGRRQLEIAVALDPANALTRSYMGKIYTAENRSGLTDTQFELAKRFDPLDPTPWLYDALNKLHANRPVEALRDLRTAIDKNGNRAVFRSRLLLDEDLATRSAGLGRLNTELGFGQLALLRGWTAIADDPRDYAGHRLLADVYSTAPRHEIARVSELLVSQLLQPVNVTPIKAQLGQPSRFIAGQAGPSDLAFSEFASPILSSGLRFQGSAVSGGNNTVGEDLVLAGLNDRLSYSIGQFRFATDGFRANNDLDQRVANAFVQFRPDPRTSLQAELRSSRTEHGDLALMFDPQRFSPVLRVTESAESLRVGLRRDFAGRDTLLGSVIVQDVAALSSVGAPFSLHTEADGYSLDLQQIHSNDRWRLQSGLVYAQRDSVDVTQVMFPGPPPVSATTTSPSTYEQRSLYGYAHWLIAPTLTVTAGASADALTDEFIDVQAVNPKVGLIWQPTVRLTLRMAVFETLQGTLTTSPQNPQPRLEPVQIAGFNQILFGGTADAAVTRGIALDHTLSERLFAGIEVTRRDFDRTLLVPTNPTQSVVQAFDTAERSQHAYVYWTPLDQLSVSAQYQHDRLHSAPFDTFGYADMNLKRLPIELHHFAPFGLSTTVRATHVRQTGNFSLAPQPGVEYGEDQFWVLDASIGYRLRNRRGMLSMHVDNLLDTDFRFQDIDPENPSIMPERMLAFRFTVAFD